VQAIPCAQPWIDGAGRGVQRGDAVDVRVRIRTLFEQELRERGLPDDDGVGQRMRAVRRDLVDLCAGREQDLRGLDVAVIGRGHQR